MLEDNLVPLDYEPITEDDDLIPLDYEPEPVAAQPVPAKRIPTVEELPPPVKENMIGVDAPRLPLEQTERTPDLIPLDYEPVVEGDEGSFIPELGKGVAAGAVETTGSMLKGVGATRQEVPYHRAQEEERSKTLQRLKDTGVISDADVGPGGMINYSTLPEAKAATIRQEMAAAGLRTPVPDIRDDPWFQAGQATQDWSKEQFKAAKDYENSWTRKLSQGAGSLAPFLVASAVPGVGIAAGTVGGVFASAGETVDMALKNGATPDQVMSAIAAGMPIGMTEQASVEALLSKIPVGAWGKVVTALGRVGAKAMVEGGQEAVQQAMQNAVAKYVYKPDQDIMEGVWEAAAIGGIIGGGVHVATMPFEERVPNQAAPAKAQTAPGITQEEGLGPPVSTGGTIAATPQRPTTSDGVVTTQEYDKEVVGDPAAAAKGTQVEVVAGVPADAAAALQPAQAQPVAEDEDEVFPEYEPEEYAEEGDPDIVLVLKEQTKPKPTAQAAPAPAPPAPVAPAAPVAPPAPANANVEGAPLPIPQAPTVPTPPALPPAPRPVVPMPEPMPTEGARYKQPPVAAEFQPAVPPIVEEPEGDFTTYEEPEGDLDVVEALPLAPVEAPAPAPIAAELPPAAPEAVQETQKLKTAEIVRQKKERAPEPAVAKQKLVHTPVSRQLGDAVKLALRSDQISDHPGFTEAVEAAAVEAAQDAGKGVAVNKAVADRVEKTIAGVRERISAEEVQAQARAKENERLVKQEEDLDLKRAQDIARARRLGAEGSKQKARAGKAKGKTAEEAATEAERTTAERGKKELAKPIGQRDQNLIAYHREYVKRGKIKGKGTEKAEAREQHTKMMEIYKALHLEAQAEKDAAAAAEQEAKRRKLAEEKRVQEEQRSDEEKAAAQEAAKTKAEHDKAVAAAKRKEKSEPILAQLTRDSHDTISAERFPTSEQLTNFVKRAKAKLKAAGETLPTKVSSKDNSPHENLVVFAQQLAEGRAAVAHLKRPGFNTARFFLESGNIKDFYDFIGDREFSRAQELTARKEAQAIRRDVGGRVGVIRSEPEAYGKGGPIELTAAGKTANVNVTRSMSGTELLNMYGKPGRLASLIPGLRVFSNMHMKQLKQLVGDIDVHFAPQDEVQQFYKGDNKYLTLDGFFAPRTTDQIAAGEKPFILLSERAIAGNTPAQNAHLVIHEMTHAATSWAVQTNYRGSAEIVTRMMSQLKAQLQQNGVWLSQEFRENEGQYAFTKPSEFIAEAFSRPYFQDLLASLEMPLEMQRSLAGLTDKAPTWWQAFTAFVQNTIGMPGFGGRARDYFSGVVALHPELMQSSQEQATQRATLTEYSPRHAADMFKPGLSAAHMRTPPRHMFDIFPMLTDAQDRIDALATSEIEAWGKDPRKIGTKGRGVLARVKGGLGAGWRRGAPALMTTKEMDRQGQPLFGGEIDNDFHKKIDEFLITEERAREEAHEGDLLTVRANKIKGENQEEFAQFVHVGNEATLAQIDPSVPLSHKNNSHVEKTGERHAHMRDDHARVAKEFDKLDPETQKLFKDFQKHYVAKHNKEIKTLTTNVIRDAVEHYDLKLPAGETLDSTVDWVLDGGIDREEGDPNAPKATDRTPRDAALHKALGGTVDALKGTKSLRTVKGTYFPLKRFGRSFFTATLPVDAAKHGGTLDPEAKHKDVIVFDSKQDLQAYRNSPERKHRIQAIATRHFNPVTGERTIAKESVEDPKTGRTLSAVKKYYVTVQNRVMEMNDSTSELEAKRGGYQKNGYQVSDIGLAEESLHSQSALVPIQVRRMLKSIEQSGKSDLVKKNATDGIMSHWIRQMAGARAQKSRLKRENVEGFDEDFIRAIHSHNHLTSRRIATLERGVDIALADERVKKYIEAHRKNDYGNLYDTTRRQQLNQELDKRITGGQSYYAEPTADRLTNLALTASSIKSLASPAYSFLNLMQPMGSTLPELTARYGAGSALRHAMRAWSDVGRLATLARGGLDTLREAGAFAKALPKIITGKQAPLRTRRDWDEYIINRLGNDPTVPNRALKIEAIKEAQRLGFGAGSGLEVPELHEIGKTGFEIGVNRLNAVFRELPKSVEALNRYGTIFATIDAEVASGKRQVSDKDMPAFAASMVEKTQGGYNAANNPNIFDTKTGKLLFQYKKFPLNYGQMYWGAVARLVGRNTDKETRKLAAKQVLAYSAMSAALAGTTHVAVMEAVKYAVWFAAAMGLGDGDWEEKEKALEGFYKSGLEMVFGKGAVADWGAELMAYGMFRALGIEVSNRLGADSLLTMGSPKTMDKQGIEAWIFEQLRGAPAGLASDVIQQMSNGDYLNAAMKLMPRFVQDINKSLGIVGESPGVMEQKTTKSGKEYGEETGIGGAIGQALGFKSRTDARQYEYGGSSYEYKQDKREKEQRSAVMNKWLTAEPGDRQDIWVDEIRPWNEAHPDAKITRGDLVRNKKRRKTEAKKQRQEERKKAWKER